MPVAGQRSRGGKPKGKAGRASAGRAGRRRSGRAARPASIVRSRRTGPRSAPDRGAGDRGPWRPSGQRPGASGPRRGPWKPSRSRVGDPTDAPTGARRTARTTRRPGRHATSDRPAITAVGVRPPVRTVRSTPRSASAVPRRTAAGPWRPTRHRGGRRPVAARRTGDRGPPRHPVARRPDRRPRTAARDRGDPPRDRGQSPDRPPWRPDRPGGPPAGRSVAAPGRTGPAWPRPAESLPAPDLLGPDEELVAGRRPVEEVFAAGRTAHRLLVVPQRRNALEQLVLHATRLRIPIVEVEGGSLTAIAGFDGHQGVALVVEPRRFASLDDILARAEERGEPPFVLVLDSLEDPQNVGTLLRSAEAAGVHGVVFPTRRQAPLTPAAVKASAGATEHLLLCPVDDLPGALADLHAHGLRIAGSEADAPLTARQTDLRGPLAIVVGSEGQGLGRRSAGAATCSCGSRCAARSGRSTPPWPARSCCSRRSPSATGRRRGPRHRRRAPPSRPRTAPAAETTEPADAPAGDDAQADDPEDSPRPPRSQRPPPSRPRLATEQPCRAAPSHRQAASARRRGPPARRSGASRPATSRASRGRPARPTLDPSDRAALSFPGADRVICGMALPVAPT